MGRWAETLNSLRSLRVSCLRLLYYKKRAESLEFCVGSFECLTKKTSAGFQADVFCFFNIDLFKKAASLKEDDTTTIPMAMSPAVIRTVAP